MRKLRWAHELGSLWITIHCFDPVVVLKNKTTFDPQCIQKNNNDFSHSGAMR